MQQTSERKIFVTGGLGFVGRHLCSGLLRDGHRVTASGRTRHPAAMIDHPQFTYVPADTTQRGSWQDLAADSDVVVNLAGKSIFTRWTRDAKQKIRDSRILTTRNLADALKTTQHTVLISTSAVGYYGDRGEDVLTESEPPGDDFLARVGVEWEREARRVESDSARVVLARFGIVLGRGGGAMGAMLPAFKWFLGGRLGSGDQWFPWIHMNDLVDAYRLLIADSGIAGPVNLCAPQPVRNRHLTQTLARTLGRPAILPVPEPVVKVVLGEFGETLLASIRAIPTALHDAGFTFTFPELAGALTEIVKEPVDRQ